MSRYKGKKGRAWDAVKAWTRAKYKHCYTCGARNLSSYNAQAGHAFPVSLIGSNSKLAWDEKIIRLQCGRCNGAGQGEQVAFRAGLVKEYGEEAVKKLEARKHKVDPLKDWDEVIERYTRLKEEADSCG